MAKLNKNATNQLGASITPQAICVCFAVCLIFTQARHEKLLEDSYTAGA